MPYPLAPAIKTSYTAVEQSLGNGTLPGQGLDVDFAAIVLALSDTINFLKGVTRADGQLANGSVTSDTLAASVRIGFDAPAPWATSIAYTTRSTAFQGFGFYLCTVAHTSGVFATDLAAGRWLLLANLTPPAGALIASSNLLDLPDKTASRANLLLGTAATVNSGVGASDFRTNAQNDARFQLLSTVLNLLAAQTPAADQLPYYTGAATAALTTLSAFARTLIDDVDAVAARATLGLVIGTNVQATDADLTAIAALVRTRGDLIVGGATDWTDLALGTNTQVLTSNGTDAVWAVPIVSKIYQAPDVAMVLAGAYGPYAHGLGVLPSVAQTFIICTTADIGYAVGDILTVSPSAFMAATLDATNVNGRFPSAAPSAYHKTTGVNSSITLARWNLRMSLFA